MWSIWFMDIHEEQSEKKERKKERSMWFIFFYVFLLRFAWLYWLAYLMMSTNVMTHGTKNECTQLQYSSKVIFEMMVTFLLFLSTTKFCTWVILLKLFSTLCYFCYYENNIRESFCQIDQNGVNNHIESAFRLGFFFLCLIE